MVDVKYVFIVHRDFVAPGARFEINVDNAAMTDIRSAIKNPSMYAFDLAQVSLYVSFEKCFMNFFVYARIKHADKERFAERESVDLDQGFYL